VEAPAKPTLLTFHGSGSNDTIHSIQLARLTRFLRAHFEIESLSGKSNAFKAPFPIFISKEVSCRCFGCANAYPVIHTTDSFPTFRHLPNPISK
jgi:hypothetical protein